MFDAKKFLEEFEAADTYTMIKGLCLKLSSAENDIDRTAIMSHLFDMVDLAETDYKGLKHYCDYDCDHWTEISYKEYKKRTDLERKLEAIQKAAST